MLPEAPETDDGSDLAPGWDAIDAALAPVYGDQDPMHWGTVMRWSEGGDDPLDGISAYRREHPVPHWHFVSYGMTELYGKESGNPDWSGYGFEFTLRVACAKDDGTPPGWALGLLQNLARYVWNSGNGFDVGHYFDLNGPIALGTDTAIRALLFVADPELPVQDTPHGRMQFLQIVGITLDELGAIRAWSGEAAATVFAGALPLLVTDLRRPSLRDSHPAIAAALEEGALREGSRCDAIYIQHVAWQETADGYQLTLGANGVRELPLLLRGRLGFGQALTVHSREAQVAFKPAKKAGVRRRKRAGAVQLQIDVPPELLEAVCAAVPARAGDYTIAGLAQLRITIERSEIRAEDGTVVHVIG